VDETWIAIILQDWQWGLALSALVGFGFAFGAGITWFLRVRPAERALAERESQRPTLPVVVPAVPPRAKTDTLISRC
jgi:hypothetical protein